MVKMSVEINKDVIDRLKRAISRYESYSFTKLSRTTTDALAEVIETVEPSEEREKELERTKEKAEEVEKKLGEEKERSKEAIEEKREVDEELGKAKEEIEDSEKEGLTTELGFDS